MDDALVRDPSRRPRHEGDDAPVRQLPDQYAEAGRCHGEETAGVASLVRFNGRFEDLTDRDAVPVLHEDTVDVDLGTGGLSGELVDRAVVEGVAPVEVGEFESKLLLDVDGQKHRMLDDLLLWLERGGRVAAEKEDVEEDAVMENWGGGGALRDRRVVLLLLLPLLLLLLLARVNVFVLGRLLLLRLDLGRLV